MVELYTSSPSIHFHGVVRNSLCRGTLFTFYNIDGSKEPSPRRKPQVATPVVKPTSEMEML
jgi:hypothetical protein